MTARCYFASGVEYGQNLVSRLNAAAPHRRLQGWCAAFRRLATVKAYRRLHLPEDRDLKGRFACFKDRYTAITMQSPARSLEMAR